MEKIKLGDIASVITKGTTPTSVGYNFIEKGINFIKIEAISEEGNFIKEKFAYISKECNSKLKRSQIEENDILFSIAGAIGRVAIVNDNVLPANTNQALAIIRVDSRYDKEFLAFLLKSPFIQRQYNKKKQGVAQINLSLKDIAELEIPIIDINKQLEIKERLKKLINIISAKKTQLEDLDNFIKSQFIEMFGDPMENPKNNKIVKLSEIAEYWNGLTYKPTDVNKVGTIVLRSSNIQNSQLDYQNIVKVNCNIKDKQYVKDNDILMCSRNGSAKLVGKVAVIKNAKERMTFGAFMMIIRSEYYPYLFSYFQMDAFRNQIKSGATTTINQITRNMLNKIKLPLPDRKDIEQFAKIVKKIDKQKVEIQKSLEEIQQLKESLLNQYFKF